MPFVIIKTNTEHSLVYAKSFFFSTRYEKLRTKG